MAYQAGSFEQQFMDPFGSRTTSTLNGLYEMTEPDQPPWYSLFYTTDMMKSTKSPLNAAPPAVKAAVEEEQKKNNQTQTANAEKTGEANVEGFRGGRYQQMQHYQMMQIQSMNNTINLLIMFLFLIIIICAGIIFSMIRRGREAPAAPINFLQSAAPGGGGGGGLNIQAPSV